MRKMVRTITLILVAALLICCESIDIKGLIMPTGDVVDKRFERSMELNGNKVVARVDVEEEYKVYVCADPHVEGTYKNLRAFCTQQRNNREASFGVVLGDCDNLRNTLPTYLEAIRFVEEEQTINSPIFTLIGNHDLYFNGWDEFAELMGPSVYWFEAQYATGCDLYIALDSASGTLGYKQMAWLREFIETERAKYRHCIVMTHTNLFYTDNTQLGSGNMPLEETATLAELFSKNNVTLCLQGHDHFREDLRLGGVRYTIVPTIGDLSHKPEYLVLHITNEGAELEWMNVW